LWDIGLFATVRTLQRQINDSDQLVVELHTHGDDGRLDRNVQNSIYRIIQELLQNINKHANAKRVEIQLNVFEDLFNLVVEDDGVGFDVNNLLNKGGIGLREIEYRVKTMSGELTIDSGRGAGTNTTIDIPLNEKDD
jgi:signal transduction histidine kinase